MRTTARWLWAVVVVSAIALAALLTANGYQADRDGTGGGPQATELALAVVCVAALVAAVVVTRRARKSLPSARLPYGLAKSRHMSTMRRRS